LKSFWEIPFIVVDVETSGSNSEKNRIMEIACVTTIGGEIINVFSSLINPHEPIPPFVAKMTGITNTMTKTSPEAYEIMPRVEELFNQKDAVFVAHNARFDWSFVVQTFALAGLPRPRLPRLCTLKFARRLLPKKVKKNVGELAEYLNITVKNRHRAAGDAIATAHILNELLELAEHEHGISTIDEVLKFQNKQIRNFRPSATVLHRFEQHLKDIPDSPGVYSFLDKNDKILFVEKSRSLSKKLNSFFSGETMTSKKIAQMTRTAEKLQWETSGSFLAAAMLEAKIIKTSNPPYNTASKDFRNFPFIKLVRHDKFPFLELAFNKKNDGNEYFGPFARTSIAHQLIRAAENKFKIRKCSDKLTHDYDFENCYFYRNGNCPAPCASAIEPDEYLKEIDKVAKFLSGNSHNVAISMQKQLDLFSDNIDDDKKNSLKQEIAGLKEKYTNLSSLNNKNNNYIYLCPLSEREKTLDLYIIKHGKLLQVNTIGTRAELTHLFSYISSEFFNKKNNDIPYQTDTDIRIINLYNNRHKDFGELLDLDGKSEAVFFNELIHKIQQIKFKPGT